MGYVLEEIAEDHQRVRVGIFALDDDKRVRRALQIAKGIDLYRYEVKFSLIPASRRTTEPGTVLTTTSDGSPTPQHQATGAL